MDARQERAVKLEEVEIGPEGREARNLPGRAAQRHSCEIAVRRMLHECRMKEQTT